MVPVTRNAVADHAQAEQEGIEAAKDSEPSKAEKAASKPKHKPAAKKSSASDSKATADASKTEKIAAKRDEADEKNQPPGSAADAVPSWMPFGGSSSDKQ